MIKNVHLFVSHKLVSHTSSLVKCGKNSSAGWVFKATTRKSRFSTAHKYERRTTRAFNRLRFGRREDQTSRVARRRGLVEGTCGERGIPRRWRSTRAPWGWGSLQSWRSDAEHPSTSAQDWGETHETESHQTCHSFSPCSTQSQTTEETLQLGVILWKEPCGDLATDWMAVLWS